MKLIPTESWRFAGTIAERQKTAEEIVGQIEWLDDTKGYCQCPGVATHTTRNNRRDCLVYVDVAPQLNCFHQNCKTAREATTRRLRDALAKLTESQELPLTPKQIESIQRLETRQHNEELLLRQAVQFQPKLTREFAWPLDDLHKNSPTALPEDPAQHGPLLLQLFQPADVIWLGQPTDSCNADAREARKAECAQHFQRAGEWLQETAPLPYNFTCGSAFKPASFSRSNNNVATCRFLVLESDTLSKEETLAALKWCQRFMRLRAIVDTAGKSLHAWFEMPADDVLEELKVILPVWGFDPALFKPSQPCRFPGVQRPDKEDQWQRLLWLDLQPSGAPLAYQVPSSALSLPPDIDKYWTAGEIFDAQFREPNWVLPGLIPTGVTLLVGPPKIGKSWLSLGVALTVAAGGKALGSINVAQGSVLLLALEDSPRRLKKRLHQMLGNRRPSNSLIIRSVAEGWPRMDVGGVEYLAKFLDEHAEVTCVMIDTLQKIKPVGHRHQNNYENDYDAITPLHKLANERDIAIVLVHHTRKMRSDDVFEEVSGSQGLTGAADTTLVIKRARGQSDAILHVTGRDVEERELALRFDSSTGEWTLLGNAAEVCASSQRQVVRDFVKASGRADFKQIRDVLKATWPKTSDGAAKMLVWRMVQAGEMRQLPDKSYAVPQEAALPTENQPPEPSNQPSSINASGVTAVTTVTPVTGVTGVTVLPADGKGGLETKDPAINSRSSVTTVIGVTPVTSVTTVTTGQEPLAPGVDGSGLGNALPSVTKGVTAPKPINTRVPEESNTCNTSNTSYAVTARAEFAECQTPELDKSRVDNYNRDFSDTALSNSANSAVPTANADDEEEERVVL